MLRSLAGAAALAVALAGCSAPGERGPAPTPVPEMTIVTVTPGTPRPAVAGSYVVANGDTLSGIAARFGVAEDAIIAANGLENRDQLFVGQDLVIPPP